MAKPWKIVDLDPNKSLKSCLRKIVQTRFQEMFSYEHGTIEGEDKEALHDMRVSARRLRAILRIFGGCFPQKKFRKQDEKLNQLIQSLGAVREQDVFIEMLVDYRKTLEPDDGKIIDLLLSQEQIARMALRKQMLRYLQSLHKENYAEDFNQYIKDSL